MLFLNRLKTSQKPTQSSVCDMSTAEFSVWWSLSLHISELTSFQEICCPSWPYLVVSTQVKISAIVSILWEVQSNKVATGKTNGSRALCCWPACKSLLGCLFLIQKEVRLTAHICSWSELTWATNNLGQGGYPLSDMDMFLHLKKYSKSWNMIPCSVEIPTTSRCFNNNQPIVKLVVWVRHLQSW